MTESKRPLDVALASTEAWTSHDMDRAAKYVGEDVVLDGPMGHAQGVRGYMEGLTGLSKEVEDFRLIAAYGDDEQALLMYDLITRSYGTLTCAKHLVVRDGRIRRDLLTFDSDKIAAQRLLRPR
jgi:SnoaL-like protein